MKGLTGVSEASGKSATFRVVLLALGFALALAAVSMMPAGEARADDDDLAVGKVSEVGTQFTVDGNTFKVTEAYEGPRDLGEVKLVKYGSSKKAASFNTVKHDGKVYEVDEIGRGAFNNAKGHKITSVKLGKHVDEVGAKAFYGCSKIKRIDIAKSDIIEIRRSARTGSYYIDDLDIGKKAFAKAGVKNVKVKCGKSNASYRKLVKKALVSRGLKSSAKVVK